MKSITFKFFRLRRNFYRWRWREIKVCLLCIFIMNILHSTCDKKERVIFSSVMDLDKKRLNLLLCAARFLGVSPYKWKKSVRQNFFFQSVLTPRYVSNLWQDKFWIKLWNGCIHRVFHDTDICNRHSVREHHNLRKKMVKLTIISPKNLASVNLASDNFFFQNPSYFLLRWYILP